MREFFKKIFNNLKLATNYQRLNRKLLNASLLGDLDLVNILIKKGADVNAFNYLGHTPLHLASVFGYTETAKLLIEKGANVNAVDKYGDTPLHMASEEGYTEIAELIKQHGGY